MSDKKKRKWVKWAVLITVGIIIGTAAFAAYRVSSQAAKALLASANNVQAEKGDIAVVVQASGSLKPLSSTTVYSPLTAQVGALSVKNGDAVKKGDVLFTLISNTIDDEIAALKSDLAAQDSKLLMADKTKSAKIASPVSGRVKAVYAVPGQEIGTAMQSGSGLVLISADDQMELHFVPAVTVSAGDQVTVTIGTAAVSTTILSFTNDEVTILVKDDSYEIGSSATATAKDGTLLGTGTLAVHIPYYVTGSEGVISKVTVDINQTVSAGDTLINLENSVYSSTYLELLASRQNTLDQLSQKQAQKEQLTVRAPQDGVVENLIIVQGTTVTEGSTLFSIGSTDAFELTVAVDELDIANVQVGQTADIALDALAGATYTGKVTRISGTGNYANGMTTYNVSIQVDQSEKILSGMSARADILVASHQNVLLIPVSAIKSIDGEKYVMVMPAPGSKEASSSSEGVQTKITVGLFNSTQAEVLSGIQEGQYVQDLSVTTASTGFAAFRNQNSNTSGAAS